MRLVIALALLASAQSPPADRRWERMDYGPFLSSCISMPWPKGAVVPKGIVIRLGADAAVCFDTDLLRVAGGWTGGWLTLLGPVYDGVRSPDEKTRPAPAGTLRFATRPGPGWARGDDFRDPRPEPYGPLPADRAKWRGLYVHGDRVVLSYTVGTCPVLELPGFDAEAGPWTFRRVFRMGPSTETLSLLVCDEGGSDVSVGTLNAPEGSAMEARDGRVILRIPPLARPAAFSVALGPKGTAKFTAPINDLERFTRGGPGRFPETIVTRGVLGKSGKAYEVDTLTVPEENPWHSWMRFGGLDFFSDGRAALSTWSGDVWIVSGIDDRLESLSWRRFATGLFQPLGIRVVDDRVHVAGRDQITRLHDLNGDGEADFYESFNNDFAEKGNYHEFLMGLETDAEGNFYTVKGGLGANFPAGPSAAHHGCVLKLPPDGSRLEVVATGIRAGNGLAVTPAGEIYTSDNNGHWGPSSKLLLVRKGGYYGDPHTAHLPTVPVGFEPPLCWIPMGVDNSCGGQVWVTSDRWGPFKDRLLHTSYGTCSLFHVLIERAGDLVQGGVVRFPLTFNSGILRPRFHPLDGQLYVCGLKGWSTSSARDGGFQRVRYTGKPVHTVGSMRVTRSGVELGFTHPLDPETAGDAGNYAAQAWNYLVTEKYGSPDISVRDPKKQGRDTLEIRSVRLSADGRAVSLEIPEIRPVMQLAIKVRVLAADESPVSLEIYGTIHRVP